MHLYWNSLFDTWIYC